ncbi:hypothetical protein COLO4_09275 [Corchorus olitorius]|uniref:Uncharacterized protein n=1 Tax=Corchorus olitorius TaxID=93759 RepID=A0A1R3KCN9_9ROSI|nr:hypothetical protein COLO4_09275 [Corchorus olitorius]
MVSMGSWGLGVVIGFVALVLTVYFGLVFIRLVKTKRIQAIERQADEGVIFDSRWVGSSKILYAAAVTRTQPECPLPRLHSLEDQYVWRYTADGKFTAKKSYEALLDCFETDWEAVILITRRLVVW